MAANQAHYVGFNTPKFPAGRWWVEWVGLFNDRLYVTFRNGDCALYYLDLAASLVHLANLRGTNHPGAYVNYNLYRGNIPYEKIADPTGQILDPIPVTAGPNCAMAGLFGLETRLLVTVPGGTSGWLQTGLNFPYAYSVTWTNPNGHTYNFYRSDGTGCPGRSLDNSSTGTFFSAGPDATRGVHLYFEYIAPAGPDVVFFLYVTSP